MIFDVLESLFFVPLVGPFYQKRYFAGLLFHFGWELSSTVVTKYANGLIRAQLAENTDNMFDENGFQSEKLFHYFD